MNVIQMSKAVFDFNNGENQFKVNSLYVDRVTISLKDKVPKPPKKHKKMDEDKIPLVTQTEQKKRSEADEVHFVFHNVDSHKYRLEFMPNSGYLKKAQYLKALLRAFIVDTSNMCTWISFTMA